MTTEDAPSNDVDASAAPTDDAGEEAMMFYAAILGRRPTLDPLAPDVLPAGEAGEARSAGWRGDVSRTVREELATALHLTLGCRPTWAELMAAVAGGASRRLDDARRRLAGGRGRAA